SYLETLTMTVPPNLTGGVPDGSEAITTSGLQTLSRTYTSNGGQAVRQDDYFNLTTGLTYSPAQYIGTVNTNYYSTLYAYDSRGRLYQQQMPTGTLYQTDFDGLGRPLDTRVGTSTG